MSFFLGIDAGTQSAKAELIDVGRGEIVAAETVHFGRELPEYGSPNGFVPNPDPKVRMADPLMWLDALDRVLEKLRASGAPLDRVAGISGSGQQHGSVCLNRHFRQLLAALDPAKGLSEQLRPALARRLAPIWMDHSTGAECAELDDRFGTRLQKVTGKGTNLKDYTYYTDDPAKLGEATVAKSGGTVTVYEDLDTAMTEASTSGDVITVVKNAMLDSDATIADGVTFVVDDGVRLTIENGQTLTNNGTIVNNGTITGNVRTGGSGKATAQVTFVTIPSNATVTVTGQGSDKTYDLPDGTYSYTVSANGYYSKTGSFTVSRNAQTITVKLEQIPTSSSGGSSSSEPSYSPVMDVSDGGSVKVNPRTPGEGDEVTITVDPDRGYEVGDVTVTDRSGRDVRVTAERDGTYTFEQPKGRVTIAVTFVREGTSTFFADVAETYWAYDEIAWAYENGYVNGVTATTFAPGASISRQQIWMILARIAGDDPADMAAARQWSIDNGISDGTNPGSAVTRQQLAALLYRYAQMMGYANEARVDLSSFPDAGSVASYAVEPMQWSVANSIVGGTTDGTLNPTGTATRAQFAVMLYRFWTGV